MTEQNQNTSEHIAVLEQFADQSALDGYYGLQDVCLLILEALSELPEDKLAAPNDDLITILNDLPVLITAYRHKPQETTASIINILCHPELNILLADDELAMLEDLLKQQDAESFGLEEMSGVFEILPEAEVSSANPDQSPELQNRTIDGYIATLEEFADQSAQEGFYGLQDACLLMVEALHELVQPTIDLAAMLDSLTACLVMYRQTPRVAADEIIKILRHPDLNIPLADDELAMLEHQLIADGIIKDEASDSSVSVSPAMRELVELLETEAELIDRYLLDMVVDEPESVKQTLQQVDDELERYANASNMAGFEGLAQICEHVKTNIHYFQKDIAAFSSEKAVLLREWVSQVKEYLATFNESDSGLPLLILLGNESWLYPLPAETAMIILAKLRAMDANALFHESEVRLLVATDEDVSLILPDDVNQELLDILLQELPVQTQQFSVAVQRLQSGGSSKDLEIAQRIAHTIKGSANTVGIKGIAVLTHHLEDILVACAKEQSLPGSTLLNVLIDAADCLEGMSESLIGLTEAPAESLAVLQQVLDLANRIDQTGVQELNDLPVASQKQVAAGSEPSLSAASIDNDNADRITAQTAMVRVPMEQIEHLFRISGESIILNTQASERLRRMKNQLQAMELQFHLLRQLGDELEQLIDLKDLSGSMKGSTEHGFDALEMDQYNELHTASRRMVEAAVDAREMSMDVKKELEQMNELLEYQQRLVIDSQESIMQTRLAPIASIVPRLQRSLRQTCRLTGKQSELTFSGEHLLIDGDTLNGMVDPLMHILRNAVDHGIESEDERLALEKPRSGYIAIEFDREGNNILVRCRDDGRGLDFSAIRAAAERRGVIAPGQPVSEDELKRFILRPNFSTRTQSTQTSGRGVGMDAVYFQVLALGGTLALHSTPGLGLSVEMRIPLPLSRTHALLANAGSYRVAIAGKGIKQILYPDAGALKTLDNDEEVLLLEGCSYPVTSLRSVLHIPDHPKKPRPYGAILLVENEDKVTAVQLDTITGSLDVVIKSFGHYIKKIPGFAGAAIMGDGSVSPVLDIPELLRFSTPDSDVIYDEISDSTESESLLPTVLVVDDSLSQRRALEQLLNDVGFHTRTARDGIEAVEILANLKPDIVLTDLEMPRMNGIELTAHIRAKENLKDLPIIMITSRTTQKHRMMAEDAGTDFYLVKPVREDDLLIRIQSLIEAAVA
ncbi:MAG: hybrid sensor histidine kinase/response regulator [Methylococcaceae bacterium]